MTAERREVELVSATALSPSVRSLVFRTTDGEPLAFIAGEWVDMFIPTPGLVVKRAYSIASPPANGGSHEIEIAVTHVLDGPASTALHAMPIGMRIAISAATGFFTRDDAPGDQAALFIAAGTGLAPIRAMIAEELRERSDGPPLLLLFGCRTPADILWGDELSRWARESPRFRLDVTLSRPDENWTGRTGYVQRHAVELAHAARPPVQVYVCGLSKMVHDVRRMLKDQAGLDRKAIHTERYD